MKKKVETHRIIRDHLRAVRSAILKNTKELQKAGADKTEIPVFESPIDHFNIDNVKAVKHRLALIMKAEECLKKYLPEALPKRPNGFEEILRQYEMH